MVKKRKCETDSSSDCVIESTTDRKDIVASLVRDDECLVIGASNSQSEKKIIKRIRRGTSVTSRLEEMVDNATKSSPRVNVTGDKSAPKMISTSPTAGVPVVPKTIGPVGSKSPLTVPTKLNQSMIGYVNCNAPTRPGNNAKLIQNVNYPMNSNLQSNGSKYPIASDILDVKAHSNIATTEPKNSVLSIPLTPNMINMPGNKATTSSENRVVDKLLIAAAINPTVNTVPGTKATIAKARKRGKPTSGVADLYTKTSSLIPVGSINSKTNEPEVSFVNPNLAPIFSSNIKSAPRIEKRAEDYKYTIIFRHGPFIKEFYMNDEDPIETLYKELFGADLERKLIYEDMKLSRLLLAGECGFFPGVNYVSLPEGDTTSIVKEIVLKFSSDAQEDVKVQICENMTVAGVLKCVRDDKAKDKVVVLNGQLLGNDQLISNIVDGGYVLDIIDIRLIH